jgi:Ran GTPase-activating protein (RanGAP) involved in mRNA processing and transport
MDISGFTLSQLCLEGNRFDLEGSAELAGVLAQCPSLCVLDLGRNQIGDEGAKELARVLPQCRLLQVLLLDHNSISDRDPC